MTNRSEKTYGNLVVIQRGDYKWGVLDTDGHEVVPFGKYNWIDGFDSGLCRVKIGTSQNKVNGNKWGIINESGEEVLPCEYDNIWNFLGKNRYSTRAVKDGIANDVYFHDLNPGLPIKAISHQDSHYGNDSYDDYGSHYGEYAGTYAQDVMGYSDDVIDDAFDGDPDAYWNID